MRDDRRLTQIRNPKKKVITSDLQVKRIRSDPTTFDIVVLWGMHKQYSREKGK